MRLRQAATCSLFLSLASLLLARSRAKSVHDLDQHVQVDSFAFYAGPESQPSALMKLVVGESASSHRTPHFDLSMRVKNTRHAAVSGAFVTYFTRLRSRNVPVPDFCQLAAQHTPPTSDPSTLEPASKTIPMDEHGSFAVLHPLSVPGKGGVVSFDRKARIPRSGVWLAASEVCLTKHRHVRARVRVSGHNAFGHLSGHLYLALPATLALLVAYALLSWGWLSLMARHRRALLWHHWLLAAGLHLLAVEALLKYFALRHLNAHGAHAHGARLLQLPHALASVLLAAYARLLVGFGCTGVGIAVPGCSRAQKAAVGGYALLHALLLGALRLHPLQLHQASGWPGAAGALVLALSLLDAAFLCKAIESVSGVVDALRARNQRAKYRLYRLLGRVLAAVLLLSVLCAAVDLAFVRSFAWLLDPQRWPLFYFFGEACWRLLALVAALAVCFVMRPCARSKDYMYSEEVPTKQGDAEAADAVATDAASNAGGSTFGRAPRFTFGVSDDEDGNENENGMNLTPEFPVDAVLNAGGNAQEDDFIQEEDQMWTDDLMTSPDN